MKALACVACLLALASAVQTSDANSVGVAQWKAVVDRDWANTEECKGGEKIFHQKLTKSYCHRWSHDDDRQPGAGCCSLHAQTMLNRDKNLHLAHPKVATVTGVDGSFCAQYNYDLKECEVYDWKKRQKAVIAEWKTKIVAMQLVIKPKTCAAGYKISNNKLKCVIPTFFAQVDKLGNALGKQHCAEGFKLIDSDAGDIYPVFHGEAVPYVDGVAQKLQTCIMKKSGPTAADIETATALAAAANSPTLCTHVGCKIVNDNTKPGGVVKQAGISVFHHGHETKGNSVHCKIDNDDDKCKCYCTPK